MTTKPESASPDGIFECHHGFGPTPCPRGCHEPKLATSPDSVSTAPSEATINAAREIGQYIFDNPHVFTKKNVDEVAAIISRHLQPPDIPALARETGRRIVRLLQRGI